jgi:undecaprenyl diphosphate synthase
MSLLKRFLAERVAELRKHGVRLNAIGDLEGLPPDVQEALHAAMADTADNRKGVLTLALNYGSRQEIVAAVQAVAREVADGAVEPGDIDAELLSRNLYTAGLPDPDLLIRTSGELRLSNFLLWQLSYAEFWFTETLWPDFSKEEFSQALDQFAERKRRYGGRKKGR